MSCDKKLDRGFFMVKSVKALNEHSKIKVLGSEHKFRILKKLASCSATYRQAANIYGFTKQKMHYSFDELEHPDLVLKSKKTS